MFESTDAILTGFNELDRLTTGFHRSELIVVAARPSFGKTDFVLNIIRNATLVQGKKAVLFSLESSKMNIMTRLFAIGTNIDKQKIRSQLLHEEDFKKFSESAGEWGKADFLIEDAVDISIKEMREKILEIKGTPDLIVVDYLGLIRGDFGQNRYEQVTENARQLKNMAYEFSCPVILVSQVSRELEDRMDKRPILSDLRDSGKIEEAADSVIFLYCEDYYYPDSERKNITEVILAKHRNGPVAKLELVYLKSKGIFANLENM